MGDKNKGNKERRERRRKEKAGKSLDRNNISVQMRNQ